MPGMVDTHVHLMDPSATEREDFPTGTAAAAIAGVTTIIEHAHGGPVREPGRAARQGRVPARPLARRLRPCGARVAGPDRPRARALGRGRGVLQGLHLHDPWRARLRRRVARGAVHRGRGRGWRVPRPQRGGDPRRTVRRPTCAPAAGSTRRSSLEWRSRDAGLVGPGRHVAARPIVPGVRAVHGARQHTGGHRDGRPRACPRGTAAHRDPVPST